MLQDWGHETSGSGGDSGTRIRNPSAHMPENEHGASTAPVARDGSRRKAIIAFEHKARNLFETFDPAPYWYQFENMIQGE